jgi:microcystin-dependent protein
MSQDPFVAEIALFPYNFVPKGWALCEGQLMPISQNTALFSLLGTFYGGDGKSTFALPNLQGMVAMGVGAGQGLTPRDVGETAGVETVTLLSSEIPFHSHNLMADNTLATSASPSLAVPSTSDSDLYHSVGGVTETLPPVGGDQPHQNMQPYLTLSYCIALTGVFPPRP